MRAQVEACGCAGEWVEGRVLCWLYHDLSKEYNGEWVEGRAHKCALWFYHSVIRRCCMVFMEYGGAPGLDIVWTVTGAVQCTAAGAGALHENLMSMRGASITMMRINHKGRWMQAMGFLQMDPPASLRLLCECFFWGVVMRKSIQTARTTPPTLNAKLAAFFGGCDGKHPHCVHHTSNPLCEISLIFLVVTMGSIRTERTTTSNLPPARSRRSASLRTRLAISLSNASRLCISCSGSECTLPARCACCAFCAGTEPAAPTPGTGPALCALVPAWRLLPAAMRGLGGGGMRCDALRAGCAACGACAVRAARGGCAVCAAFGVSDGGGSARVAEPL